MKKINFCLPNFYENIDINIFLKDLKEDWFKFPVNFFCFTGNFPSCYWRADYNSMGEYIDYGIINNFCEQNRIPIKLDCNNIYNIEDCDDALGNLILDKCQTGSNLVEVSSLLFLNIIKEKYPYYNFVYNAKGNIIKENDLKDCKYIKITKNSDITRVKEKKKLILALNSSCSIDECPYEEICDFALKEDIRNYYKRDKNFICKYQKPYGSDISFSTIEEYYNKGITKFELAPAQNKEEYINFLINFFIREERQLEVISILSRKGIF